MGWLTGWDDRLELEINKDKVDGDLTDFPVLVKLSSDIGEGSFDATGVFTSYEDSTTVGTTYSTGNGLDGSLAVTSDFNLNTNASGSRTHPDGVAYPVGASPTGTSIDIGVVPSGIVAGDVVLLMNIQGTQAYYEDVGNYDILTVSSVDGTTLNITTSITKSYDSGDFNTQRVIVQRIPQYTDVTISNNSTLTAAAWDGFVGNQKNTGIVALFVTGQIDIQSGSSIDVTDLGFLGAPSESANGGQQPCGTGPLGDTSTNTRGRWDTAGGGGYHGSSTTGGGGAGKFIIGERGGVGLATNYGLGGQKLDDIYLAKIFLSAAGGCGSSGGSGGSDGHPAGSSGAGMVFIVCNNMIINGDIFANGTDGYDGTSNYMAGGGGGAGATVFIQGSVASAENITIAGGTGGTGDNAGNGGDGADGLIFTNEWPITYTSPTIVSEFIEDFTDGTGDNWTYNSGDVYYDWGYQQHGNTGSAYTTSPFIWNDYWEFSCMWVTHGIGSANDQSFVYLGWDTPYYQVRLYMRTYSTGDNSIAIQTNSVTGTVVLHTNTKYNYWTEYRKWFNVKLRREGPKLHFKVWLYNEDEPSSWDWSGNMPTDAPDEGRIFFSSSTEPVTGAGFDRIRFYRYESPHKKIAITAPDGTTQLPVEVENWSQSLQEAYLWTKVPSVVSGTGATIYLYYDKDHIDNDVWVGDTGSVVASDVWTNNYISVWHMNIDMTNTIKDSVRSYHATPTSMSVANFTDTPTGPGLSFASGDYLTPSVIDLVEQDVTMEVLFKLQNYDTNRQYIFTSQTDPPSGETYTYQTAANMLINGTTSTFSASHQGDPGAGAVVLSTDIVVEEEWTHWVATMPIGGYSKLYRDGNLDDTATIVNPSKAYAHNETYIGARKDSEGDDYLKSDIGILTLSSGIRPAAWVKASYFSTSDNLMTYTQGVKPYYYYHGYITEKATPVERIVRLYNRQSGALMDETTSSGDGYYYLTTAISGEHYVAAFDDDAGDDYNAVILDKLQPLGIE